MFVYAEECDVPGTVISEHGVATDPAKIEAVSDWPVPTSLTEVRAFVGLASYYRRFVKRFLQDSGSAALFDEEERAF